MVLSVDRPSHPAAEGPATAPGALAGVWNASLDWPELQRYRYFLWFAPRTAIELAHEDAFAAFTPDEREAVQQALQRRVNPVDQWDPALEGSDPRTLAFLATRVELRRPGEVERALRRRGPGTPDLLAKLVAGVVASAAGRAFFAQVSDPAHSS
jgi:hypothetical protein